MKPISLKKLFFKNTVIVILGVMVTSAIIFDFAYRKELQKSVHDRLKLHIYTLLSLSEFSSQTLILPDISYHPLLNTADSGLWAAVVNQGKFENPVWQSLSIEQLPNELPLSQNIGYWNNSNIHFNGNSYFTTSFKVSLKNNNKTTDFNFIVADSKESLNDSIKNFRFWLFTSFIAFSTILLISQAIALRLSFKPIKYLEREIAELDNGNQDLLSQNYPDELVGITTKLNGLINKERDQRNRYRTSMSDLAHSLKTPMAVINAEINHYKDNPTLRNAITRIDNSIEYQLRRAVICGHNIISNGVNIFNIIQMIKEALDKIYIHKNVELTINIPKESKFFGDENDLMEIMGNLMDNAYKFSRKKIIVFAEQNTKMLTISIEDDGNGLDETSKMKIFNRGGRMDEKQLGQGIGLAVVNDIVNNYEGKITTTTSSLGGALFIINFPYESNNNA